MAQTPIIDNACGIDGDDAGDSRVAGEMANGILMRGMNGGDGEEIWGGEDVDGMGVCARDEYVRGRSGRVREKACGRGRAEAERGESGNVVSGDGEEGEGVGGENGGEGIVGGGGEGEGGSCEGKGFDEGERGVAPEGGVSVIAGGEDVRGEGEDVGEGGGMHEGFGVAEGAREEGEVIGEVRAGLFARGG